MAIPGIRADFSKRDEIKLLTTTIYFITKIFFLALPCKCRKHTLLEFFLAIVVAMYHKNNFTKLVVDKKKRL